MRLLPMRPLPMSLMPKARFFLGFGRQAVAGSLVIAVAAAVPSARAQTGEGVFAVTYLDVSPSALGQGVDLLKKFRDAGKREASNLELTVLQETSRPNRFVIVEGWKDQAALDAHDKGTVKAEFQDALKPIRNSPADRHMLQPFANAAARPAPASGALYMVEHIDFLGGDPAVATNAQPLIKGLAEFHPEGAGRGALRNLSAAAAAHQPLRGRVGVDGRQGLRRS